MSDIILSSQHPDSYWHQILNPTTDVTSVIELFANGLFKYVTTIRSAILNSPPADVQSAGFIPNTVYNPNNRELGDIIECWLEHDCIRNNYFDHLIGEEDDEDTGMNTSIGMNIINFCDQVLALYHLND